MEPNTRQGDTNRWHCLSQDNSLCKASCKVQQLLSLFSHRYTMDILRLLLMKGTLRFNSILNEIGGSPKTIVDRLEELVEAKLIKREAFPEIPPRVEYSLTESGQDLERVFAEISVWVGRWAKGNQSPSLQ